MQLSATPLEIVLKRDRVVVLAGIVAIAALAWAYTVHLAGDMGNMAMPNTQSWGAVDFATMFVMWLVMMVAMMVPTAAPMILLFASVNRKRREQEGPFVPTGVFLLGYVIAWTGFAALATVANWGLHTGGLMSSMMGESGSSFLGGGLLLAAGAFQWGRLKSVCLTHCRSPMGFLMTGWRDGVGGALRMGMGHGVFCLGCCWVLMTLLFVLGVMNLIWIAALSGFVLLEKIALGGHRLSRVTGFVLIVWAALMFVGVAT